MRKRIYVSADYSLIDGDRDVVKILNDWSKDKSRLLDFVDMSQVVSGSISSSLDCRACDLKREFNNQINASSAAIFVVGDKTSGRKAGSNCKRNSNEWSRCRCTPYKQNTNGSKLCKHPFVSFPGVNDDIGCINEYSYLRHEFEQAVHRNKTIIIVYNSLKKEPAWLPDYMKEFEDIAAPFWIKNNQGNKVGNYEYIKRSLGYA